MNDVVKLERALIETLVELAMGTFATAVSISSMTGTVFGIHTANVYLRGHELAERWNGRAL